MKNDKYVEEAEAVLNHLIRIIRKWLPQREDTIKLLREIADKLDKITSDVNKAKLTGTSAAVFGGILTGAGALATVFTMGAAAPIVMGFGMAAAVGGGIVTGGAELKRNLNSKEKLKEVKGVLDLDTLEQKEITVQTNILRDLIFEISTRYNEDNISGEQVLRELFGDGATGVKMLRTIDPRKESQERLSASQLSRVGLIPVLPFLFKSGAITSTATKTVTSFRKLQLAFRSFTKLSLQAGRSVTSVGATAASSSAQIAARGAAAVVTPVLLAIDIYQLVQTCIDVHDGSKSESAKDLRKVADGLEEELRSYEKFLLDLR
jgi:hypothetical protein